MSGRHYTIYVCLCTVTHTTHKHRRPGYGKHLGDVRKRVTMSGIRAARASMIAHPTRLQQQAHCTEHFNSTELSECRYCCYCSLRVPKHIQRDKLFVCLFLHTLWLIQLLHPIAGRMPLSPCKSMIGAYFTAMLSNDRYHVSMIRTRLDSLTCSTWHGAATHEIVPDLYRFKYPSRTPTRATTPERLFYK